MKYLSVIAAVLSLISCVSTSQKPNGEKAMESRDGLTKINQVAERYVKLVLDLGQHDEMYVDAYYGPEQWAQEAKERQKSVKEIREEAVALVEKLRWASPASDEEIVALRHQYLTSQLRALVARTKMLEGARFSFDEESKELYDAVAPHHSEDHFKEIISKLDKLVPGKGPLPERIERYRKEFVISKERLLSVFNAAIAEARKRTQEHIELPAGEYFELEFVTGKAWSGYNWYKGNSRSLIQINTDLPIFIDRAIDLASHEGYPGHHVYNVLLEEHLVRRRGWVEFTVYPLFSPQSLIAEGSANFGIEVAFPGKERIEFEKKVLFKLAGLDPDKAERYYQVAALTAKLNYAGNEAARRYLDGEINADEAAKWLVKYTLTSPERAKQRVQFFDQYRSYVINYNLGQDLVKNYIEKQGGTEANPTKRWEEFKKLISSPRLPSGLM